MAATLVARVSRSSLKAARALPFRNFSSETGLPLTFSSPSQVFYNEVQVNQVDVTSTTGSFGILPGHVPVINVLQPGLVSVYENDKVTKFFASSGSVTINSDGSVQILAEEAAPLENFDMQAARSGLEKSHSQANSATSEEAKAEAQIGVEFHEALVKALE